MSAPQAVNTWNLTQNSKSPLLDFEVGVSVDIDTLFHDLVVPALTTQSHTFSYHKIVLGVSASRISK